MADTRTRFGPDSKFRWWVARNLDNLPGFCWSDLVQWVLGWNDEKLRDTRVGEMCRQDAARNGDCYCGKMRTAALERPRV